MVWLQKYRFKKTHSVLTLLLLFMMNAKATAVTFQKKKIKIQNQILIVEIADTETKAFQGLMFRKKLGSNEGMLFIFKDEQLRTFWMKNTFLPLDIGFFSSDKKLVNKQSMKPVQSEMEKPESYSSGVPAQYVLEVNQNWFEKNKIQTGQTFSFVN